MNALAALVPLLGFQAQRRDRTSFETRQADRLAGLFAVAVRVLLDTAQRLVDLGNELPLTIARAVKNRLGSKSFWARQGLELLTGMKLPTLLLTGMNTYRTQADPTVRDIPLVASNPEAEFFDDLKDFRFADGNAFDFRGDSERSIGNKDGPLANSNQRGDKGFITTYEVERTIAFVGKFKLDWIFVKPPSLTEPYAKDQPFQFAPHFGRTLKEINEAPKDRISDHAPIMVDLPLGEPPLGKASTTTGRN